MNTNPIPIPEKLKERFEAEMKQYFKQLLDVGFSVSKDHMLFFL